MGRYIVHWKSVSLRISLYSLKQPQSRDLLHLEDRKRSLQNILKAEKAKNELENNFETEGMER